MSFPLLLFPVRVAFLLHVAILETTSNVKEEHEKKIDHRTHKWEHVHDKNINPQEQVDKQTKNFGDNF